MQTRKIGPFEVSAVSLGCMNICHAYGKPPPPEHAQRLLLTALDQGVTHYDTAAMYGFGVSETIIGKTLSSRRSEFMLASKGGMAGVDVAGDGKLVRVIDGRPETLRRNCEDSLRRLQTDVIDLYYLHRWDKKVPIEDSVGELSRLVERGLIRTIGLSEVSAATLRIAHAIHPITALQTEYSLWTRNPEIAVLQACQELGVAFVAFSPTARGFLTSSPPDIRALDPKDIRCSMPRFSPDNWSANLKLLPAFEALSQAAACTPAQLAIAWVLHQAKHIIALPGTTSLEHLKEDIGAADVSLSEEILTRVGRLVNQDTVVGSRYSAQSNSEVDTEVFTHV